MLSSPPQVGDDVVAGTAAELVVAIAAVEVVVAAIAPERVVVEVAGDEDVIAFGAAEDDRRRVDVVAGIVQIVACQGRSGFGLSRITSGREFGRADR